MVAVSTLGVALFQLAPLFWAMSESLQKFNPVTHQSIGFVGSDNFDAIFQDPAFWQSVTNTFLYSVGTTLVEIVLGLAIALLLDRSLPVTSVARTAVIAALALSESVTALLWVTMLDKDTGIVNGLLGAVGISPVGWLTTAPAAFISVSMVTVWHEVGLVVLIYLAGLQNLDDELYDAASVDGAGSLRKFYYLTLPMLRRSTVLAVFIATITSVRIFTPILIMTVGGPDGTSQNLIHYIYAQGMQNLDYGLASAATVCLVVVLIAVTALQSVLLRGRSKS
ncbi:sugar ABC transporter permease [Arthrobacter sp. MI7-26]|uniref:carbohydrate ABC transporter permease n=1 Tax=Arthrobacter sp. MI7-26 TaxID=2993653 RepID=UPI0022497BA8|nr:sugar ABC transporter permease [Arthrobacter sp. MI7-26]MCX2750458.1 sugar ABC transporter permease [Arthrobacter sp. MI7-26]